MYNFYRWYPRGKVVFLAPTRPLVAQQIDACYRIMGIPRDDTAELTGQWGSAGRHCRADRSVGPRLCVCMCVWGGIVTGQRGRACVCMCVCGGDSNRSAGSRLCVYIGGGGADRVEGGI